METSPGTRGELLVAALRLGDEAALDSLLAMLATDDEDLATMLYNAVEDLLSRSTPSIVKKRADEIGQKLAALGASGLQKRLAELRE